MDGVQRDGRLWSGSIMEQAIFSPAHRPDLLRRALRAAARLLGAEGTALIHPSADGPAAWEAVYVGERGEKMRPWLESRLHGSLDATTLALAEKCPYLPDASPVFLPLEPGAPGGLWVLWSRTEDPAALPSGGVVRRLREDLESLLEVEHKERAYLRGGSLGPDVARALARGDDAGLPALLSVARAVGDADLAYWGSVHGNVLDVEWHEGAKGDGFGFELPIGEGVGGRAFARTELLEIPDYRNCQYRYPGVSDVTDEEGVRSTLAIPIRGSTPGTGAVLYAVRRRVAGFSTAERALLWRLARSIEPVPEMRPASLFVSGGDRLARARSELRRMLLGSGRVQEVEAWLEGVIGGPAISTDRKGRPYVLGNADRLERLLHPPAREGRPPTTVPLSGAGNGERGSLLLWPPAGLPFEGWPDLLEDAAVACGVVLDRMEHVHDRLSKERSRWIRELTEEATSPHLRREGNRLGLPVDRGEAWALAWERETFRGSEQTRLKMLAEDVILDRLGDPLIVLEEEDVGVVLLRDPARAEPAAVRDDLLRYFGPAPLWLVHGAGYDSFEGLKGSLSRVVNSIKAARHDGDERYVIEIGSRELDSLLENPRLSDDLAAFAGNVLGPLLEHDRGYGFVETFCLTLALGSPAEAARRLFVHENTVRYRVRQAERILDKSLDSPKDRLAMTLAAFVWLRHRELRRPVDTS